MTRITHDAKSRGNYTVPVGHFNQLTTFEESKWGNETLKVLPYDEEKDQITEEVTKKETIK